MIRFLQTPGPIKKIVLGGLLTFISVMMAITLIPGIGGNSFLGSTPTKAVVATVSGEEISATDVTKQAKRMVEQQFPRGGPQASSLLPFFSQQAVNNLISEKLLLVEARRMGLRATDEDLRNYLHQGQLGQIIFPNGKYDQTAYDELAQRLGFTIPQFEGLVKEEILINKLRGLVSASASVTDAEVRKQFEKQNAKVKFDYAVFKKDDILKSIHPAEAELKACYDRNKNTYVNSIPEKRQLKYVVFDTPKLLAQTQVTQQDFASYYDQHREEYRVPEQVNVRHILIKSPLAGPDGKVDPKALDAARQKADDVLKQVKAGGNFEELAKKYSEDTGSAKQGGSLGWIGKGRTVPEFEKAAFSQPKGQIGDLVKSSYGFHIIRVDDRQDAHMKTPDEVKDQIEPLLKQQKAQQIAQKQAEALLNQARTEGLDAAAAAKGVPVITSDFVGRKDLLPGLGPATQFLDAVFAATEKSPPDMAPVSQGFAVFQLLAVKPPSTPSFEEIRTKLEDEFKNERSRNLLSQKAQELSDRAKASHDLKKAAKELGATVKTSDFVLPDGQVPEVGSMSGQAAVAFTLKPGEISVPISSGTDAAVLQILESQKPSETDFNAKRDQIRDSLLQNKQQELFGLFISNLRDQMQKSGKIKINQEEMKTLTRSASEEGM